MVLSPLPCSAGPMQTQKSWEERHRLGQVFPKRERGMGSPGSRNRSITVHLCRKGGGEETSKGEKERRRRKKNWKQGGVTWITRLLLSFLPPER